jgi:bifunctional non-homologous end joining protein LigD
MPMGGLEGMVSKHTAAGAALMARADATHWVKVKNPKDPAYRRVQDQF